MPIITTRSVSELRSNAITTQISANAIVVEARNVLRQDDCWVYLPPNVLPRATPNALEKEAISPIIYFLLCVDI